MSLKSGSNLSTRFWRRTMLILTAPSFADWGVFMDGQHGSVAGQIEDEFGDLADRPDSGLFESITIKAE